MHSKNREVRRSDEYASIRQYAPLIDIEYLLGHKFTKVHVSSWF